MVQTLAITGGKGGVGKTTIAVNMAVLLARLGEKTLLLDADFGMANSHILCGVNAELTVKDFLEDKKSLEDIIYSTPYGLDLLPGGTGSSSILDISTNQRGNIIRASHDAVQNYDYLVIDVPAGASEASLDFCAASERLIVVLMGEPTSFMDAYSLIKSANLDLGLEHFGVIVNQASSKLNGEALFNKFKNITDKFLSVNQTYLGYLPNSDLIRKSIVTRTPLMASKKATIEESCFNEIIKNLKILPANSFSGLKFY